MSHVLVWKRPEPLVTLAWQGPAGQSVPCLVYSIADATTLAVAAIIGPPGDDGNPGPPGPAIGDYDPGDINLYFENALI